MSEKESKKCKNCRHFMQLEQKEGDLESNSGYCKHPDAGIDSRVFKSEWCIEFGEKYGRYV